MKLVITEPAKLRLKDIYDFDKARVSSRVADKIKTGIILKLKDDLLVFPYTENIKSLICIH